MKSSERQTIRKNVRRRIVLLAALMPVATWAVCTCGFGDGLLTLTTINVNGNLADWAAVHADLDNNVCDGPSGGLTDRDAPVQSTGRDLTHFAYTYDTNNVYLFTERAGSVSNTQSFVYYADTDNDAMMETGEPVIGVTWRGSNRRINVYVYTYVAAAAGGDPMVDGGGFGDGYTLPGSFANVPSTGNPIRSGAWGSVSGTQMEFLVTWAELGVPPNSPFTFHVASSNASLGANSFTAQIDDNLSGCGGGLGSTAQPGVTFVPDLSLTGIAGQSAVGVHTLTNTGNAVDNFDFASVASGDFAPVVSYYEDTDASGTLTAADTLLTDTDGDGDPNSGLIAPSATVSFLIVYDVPATAGAGDQAAITTTATSDFQPLVIDSVTDTIDVVPGPNVAVTKEVTTISDPVNMAVGPKAIPGSVVLYTVTVTNQGAGTVDIDTFEITDAIPSGGCLIVDDIDGIGSGPVDYMDGSPASTLSYTFISLDSTADDLSFSDDNGLTYDYEPSAGASGCDPVVTNIRIEPKGEFAANLGSGSPQGEFIFQMLVN
jgi:uncharacterized repeat protein (TIGR01451 family)